MGRILYDAQAIKTMALFGTITRTELKDCIIGETITYIVSENNLGRAIGKGAVNIKKLERILKKRVKLIEWSPNLIRFIQNVIYPARVKKITQYDDTVVLEPIDLKTRGILIGRNASNLRQTEEIIKRYFKIKEIKVK